MILWKQLQMDKYSFIIKWIIVSTCLMTSMASRASCSEEQIKNIRDIALRNYNSSKYVAAEKSLSDYYSKCGFSEMASESDQVLNQGLWLISDLMLYRGKTKNYLGCLSLDDDVYLTWAKSDPARYSDAAQKAIQTNLAKCNSELNAIYIKPETCPIKGHEDLFATPASWKQKSNLFNEISCIGFSNNSQDYLTLEDKDSPDNEGMNSIARLDVLYVSDVKMNMDTSINKRNWIKQYKLDPIYFESINGNLWGMDTCYTLTPNFGYEPGMIFLDGDSMPCEGGTARNINRLIVNLEFPFKAKIIQETNHSVK